MRLLRGLVRTIFLPALVSLSLMFPISPGGRLVTPDASRILPGGFVNTVPFDLTAFRLTKISALTTHSAPRVGPSLHLTGMLQREAPHLAFSFPPAGAASTGRPASSKARMSQSATALPSPS